MMKEVVTIQVGTQSNFIATHFWNLLNANFSNSCSADVYRHSLFRELSLSRKLGSSVSYCPRVQIIDANGSFGALSHTDGRVHTGPTEQDANSNNNASESWSGSQQIYRQDPIPPHRIAWKHLQVDSDYESNANSKEGSCSSPSVLRTDVQYWSDYLTTHLHPRSLHSLQGVHHNVTDLRQFSVGSSVVTSQYLNNVYDDLRFFIEECDNFGGLNFIANSDDAFAGIAASYFEVLSEELGDSIPKLLFSAFHPDRLCSKAASAHFGKPFCFDAELLYSQNEARFLNECLDRNMQYVPLSTQASLSLPVDRTTDWDHYHLAAPLGLAVETALSPLTHNASLSAVIRAVRSSSSALLSGLFANITFKPSRTVTGKSLVQAPGTSNLSYTWHPMRLGAISAKNETDWSSLARADALLTSRGYTTSLSVSLNLKDPILVPEAFPNVFEMTSFSKQVGMGTSYPNTDHSYSIPAFAGLVNDRLNACTALKELSNCLQGDPNISKSIGIEKLDLAEVQENLKGRAEDLA